MEKVGKVFHHRALLWGIQGLNRVTDDKDTPRLENAGTFIDHVLAHWGGQFMEEKDTGDGAKVVVHVGQAFGIPLNELWQIPGLGGQ